LFRLAEREETAKHVALAIAWDIDKLPEHITKLLDRLKHILHNVIEELASSD